MHRASGRLLAAVAFSTPPMISPSSAKHARLLRLAHKLEAEGTPGIPVTDADKMVWVNSHVARQQDQALSMLEETLREPLLPLQVGKHSPVANGSAVGGENLFQHRDFPMFPGEMVPAGHNTLSSLRAELTADLTAQSLKDAWLRVSGGRYFSSAEEYYRRVDGLDEAQLGEIVAALYPSFGPEEARGLVRRVLEGLSKPDNTPTRKLMSRISAHALGLDNSPGHYTNFLEWMGRMMDSKSFKTEHAIFHFARRKFSRQDVRVMFENYNMLNATALEEAASDGYSHFYEVLKDFSVKVSGEDTRAQVGVRIDPVEMDRQTGLSFGLGRCDSSEVVCMLRENKDGTGAVLGNGKPLHELAYDRAYVMEHILWPFDEAGLNFKEFDVYFLNRGHVQPLLGSKRWAQAARMALATAITKMLPITRVAMKKSGLLSMDRRKRLPDHPGRLNGRAKRGFFRKR